MPRLDQRILHETAAGLVRIADTQFGLRHDFHAALAEDALYLADLAGVTGRKDDLAGQRHGLSR